MLRSAVPSGMIRHNVAKLEGSWLLSRIYRTLALNNNQLSGSMSDDIANIGANGNFVSVPASVRLSLLLPH